MIQSYPLKNLPPSLQALIRPMLLISLALHSILLFVPLPSKPKPVAPKKEEKVKLTKLPANSPSPKASRPLSPNPTPSRPPIARQPARTELAIRRPVVIPPLVQRQLAPQPKTQQTTQPKPQPQQSISPTPTSTPADVKDDLKTPFADFPRYTGSQPGSVGVLSAEYDNFAFNTGDPLKSVDDFFQTELKKKNYSPTPNTQFGNGDSLKVYQVSKGDKTKYLYLISQKQKTVILLADTLTDPKGLVKAEGVSPEAQAFSDSMAEISGDSDLASVVLSDLVYPDFFAKSDDKSALDDDRFKGQFKTTKVYAGGHTSKDIAVLLQTKLQGQGFIFGTQVSDQGVLVYPVTRGAFKVFISFVTTKDGETAVISSNESPFK